MFIATAYKVATTTVESTIYDPYKILGINIVFIHVSKVLRTELTPLVCIGIIGKRHQTLLQETLSKIVCIRKSISSLRDAD
jgi:hypothetical protein